MLSLPWLLPQVAPVLKAQGLVAAVPVFLLHSLAYLLGYAMPKVQCSVTHLPTSGTFRTALCMP